MAGKRNRHQQRWDEQNPELAARREAARRRREHPDPDQSRKNRELIEASLAEIAAMSWDEIIEMLDEAAANTARDRHLYEEDARMRRERRYRDN